MSHHDLTLRVHRNVVHETLRKQTEHAGTLETRQPHLEADREAQQFRREAETPEARQACLLSTKEA